MPDGDSFFGYERMLEWMEDNLVHESAKLTKQWFLLLQVFPGAGAEKETADCCYALGEVPLRSRQFQVPLNAGGRIPQSQQISG